MKNKICEFIKDIFKPDVFATFANYVVKIFLKPIIIFFVPIFLSESNQGYWYTFGSIAALTNFADLGFTSIMSQYTAHEYAYLSIDKKSQFFVGERKNIEKISSLFQFIVKWLCGVLMIAMVIIFIVGCVIFSRDNESSAWMIQWILYVIGTIIHFATQVELSFFEGCDQYAITQRIRAMASTAHCIATLIMLAAGFELYSLAIPLYIEALIVLLLMNRRFGGVLMQMLSTKPAEVTIWIKDFVPLLSRYAVSWISGYFASQIYNPLVFSKYGAAAAGKVGYSLSIITAIYGVSNVWSFLAIPKYNMAVERKEWKYMDQMMKKNICYSIAVYIIGIVFLLGVYHIPLFRTRFEGRVLPPISIAILAAGYFLLVISYGLSTYLRAHKKEPFMIPSLLNGIIGTLFTILFFNLFGVNYIFAGILIANIIVLPISIKIWSDFREKWHIEEHVRS